MIWEDEKWTEWKNRMPKKTAEENNKEYIYRDIKLNLTIIGTSYTIPKINAPKKKQKVSGCTYKEFENCLWGKNWPDLKASNSF